MFKKHKNENSFGVRNKRKKVAREDAIVVSSEMTPISECYSSLKDNLIYMQHNRNNQIIQIESSVSGEGKTTLACNLAVAMSFDHKKVLIIDFDFRRPCVNRLFKVPNENGIVDVIYEKITIEEAIKKTKYENVDVLTRGSAIFNPSVLFTSEACSDLLNKLKGSYDYILLDSPPVLQVSDYIHICKLSDGVLLVVAYGMTKKAYVKETSLLLNKTDVNVIGMVMTFVDTSDPYAYYNGAYTARYGYDKSIE